MADKREFISPPQYAREHNMTKQNISLKIIGGMFKKEDVRYNKKFNHYLIARDAVYIFKKLGRPRKIKTKGDS